MDDGVALVTGASRGLGAAIARRLAEAGRPVAVNYRTDVDGAQRVVDQIRDAGGTAVAFAADVTDEDAVTELIAQVTAEFGAVRVLVCNATGPQPAIAVADLSWRDHLDQLVFFVKSPTLLVQAVLPGLTAIGQSGRTGGRIIQIGSDVFERGLPGMSAYVAAKGAQIGLTRSWARELGEFGITVNLLAPGWIPVERHAGASADDLAGYRSGVPLGRLGVPDDVAAAVVFLASPEAGFITGQTITVNGGHS